MNGNVSRVGVARDPDIFGLGTGRYGEKANWFNRCTRRIDPWGVIPTYGKVSWVGCPRNDVTWYLSDNKQTTVLLRYVVVSALTFNRIKFICDRNKSEEFDSKEAYAWFLHYKNRVARWTTVGSFPSFCCNNVYPFKCYIPTLCPVLKLGNNF